MKNGKLPLLICGIMGTMNAKHLSVVLAALTAVGSVSAAPILKDGDTLAFLGDSITQFGQAPANHSGYVNLIIRALDAEGVRVKPVKAGISGHKSNDMLARLDRDVLSKRPQVMTLSCGVNDVWHQDNGRGVQLEDYKRNITAILDKCAASNCTVVVLTATMFERGADPAKDVHNIKLAPYNAFLREEAKRRGLPLADLNQAMWDGHAADAKARYTRDSVHMAEAGDRLMAEGVLKALGVCECRFADIAYNAWEPVWVLCRFDLKPETDPAVYVAETKAILPTVHAEEGCIEYRLLNADGSGLKADAKGKTLWMFERWASRNCLKKHGQSAHMKAFCDKVAPLRTSATVIPLQDACTLR